MASSAQRLCLRRPSLQGSRPAGAVQREEPPFSGRKPPSRRLGSPCQRRPTWLLCPHRVRGGSGTSFRAEPVLESDTDGWAGGLGYCREGVSPLLRPREKLGTAPGPGEGSSRGSVRAGGLSAESRISAVISESGRVPLTSLQVLLKEKPLWAPQGVLVAQAAPLSLQPERGAGSLGNGPGWFSTAFLPILQLKSKLPSKKRSPLRLGTCDLPCRAPAS